MHEKNIFFSDFPLIRMQAEYKEDHYLPGILERGIIRSEKSEVDDRLHELLTAIATQDPDSITLDKTPLYEELGDILPHAEYIIPQFMYPNIFCHFQTMHLGVPEFFCHRRVLGELIIYILNQASDYTIFREFDLLGYVSTALQIGEEENMTDILISIARLHIIADDPFWTNMFNLKIHEGQFSILRIAKERFNSDVYESDFLCCILHEFYELLVCLLDRPHDTDDAKNALDFVGMSQLDAENAKDSAYSMIRVIQKLMNFNQLDIFLFRQHGLPAWLCAMTKHDDTDVMSVTLDLFAVLVKNQTWNVTMGKANLDFAYIISLVDTYSDNSDIFQRVLHCIALFIRNHPKEYITTLVVEEWAETIATWMDAAPFETKEDIAFFMYNYIDAAIETECEEILCNIDILRILATLIEDSVEHKTCECLRVMKAVMEYISDKAGVKQAREEAEIIFEEGVIEVLECICDDEDETEEKRGYADWLLQLIYKE